MDEIKDATDDKLNINLFFYEKYSDNIFLLFKALRSGLSGYNLHHVLHQNVLNPLLLLQPKFPFHLALKLVPRALSFAPWSSFFRPHKNGSEMKFGAHRL